jgi:hypothetical protein
VFGGSGCSVSACLMLGYLCNKCVKEILTIEPLYMHHLAFIFMKGGVGIAH